MIKDDQDANQTCDAYKVLLIDLENCPNQIQKLLEDLEQFSNVVICYAQSGAKIPLDWLVPLSTTINSNRLKILKMMNAGKNSADFGICFSAGFLMQQLPQKTHFVILSNDKDMDHVVELLQSHGRSAERIGTKKEEIQPVVSSLDPSPSVKVYCMHLIANSKTRPAKKDTLILSIKNRFKDTPEVVEATFNHLISKGIVVISENNIVYNDERIKQLASISQA